MTETWWGKEAAFKIQSIQASGLSSSNQPPELMSASRDSITSKLLSRVVGYVPEWTRRAPDDAGIALARLFGEQLEPVLYRLNHLPDKSFIEFLRIAGVETLPARPAEALLEFEVSDSAPQTILIERGFQVGANPTEGGDMVVFETQQAIYAAPVKVAELHVKQGSRFQALDFKGDAPFLPFGPDAVPGRALFIGLSGKVVPGPVLCLGIRVAAPPGTPPPASAGGITPLPLPSAPTLRWEVLDGGTYQSVDVISDETAGFFRSGVIELGLPRQWRPSRPEGTNDGPQLRWLRIKIVRGEYNEPPTLYFVKPNMVKAQATRTIYDEILEPIADSGGRRWRLSQIPILPGSLALTVDEGMADLIFGTSSQLVPVDTKAQSASIYWQQIDDLADYHADDRVYVLDSITGEVTFGDGVHGKAAPEGFRHIHAVSYKVGGGKAGAVDAEAINALLSSRTYLKSVKNPLPATGGIDQESQQQAKVRGPQEIRVRGRAVTATDYAFLAKRAPGADIRRAYAVGGLHPIYPGKPIPGVVGVFVVPPDHGEGPPMPDEGTLTAVARFLSEQSATVGVDVVIAAPFYQRIRAEVGLIIEKTADMAETIRRATAVTNRYLDPLHGGDQGDGWPFGGTLRYPVLLRLISNVTGVHAVTRLNLVLDGIRVPSCQDVTIARYGLLWPENHEFIIFDVAKLS